MDAIACYFTSVLGLSPQGAGGCVRTALRLEAHPPFLAPRAAMELRRDGVAYRSLAADAPQGAEVAPFEKLGPLPEELLVFSPPRGPCAESGEAIALSEGIPVSGAARLPEGGRALGVVREGRFVSWACATPAGQVWNITVETDPAFRRRGYAADCLRALTNDLARIGVTPLYLCDARNEASGHTALAAGYSPYGRWLLLSSLFS